MRNPPISPDPLSGLSGCGTIGVESEEEELEEKVKVEEEETEEEGEKEEGEKEEGENVMSKADHVFLSLISIALIWG